MPHMCICMYVGLNSQLVGGEANTKNCDPQEPMGPWHWPLDHSYRPQEAAHCTCTLCLMSACIYLYTCVWLWDFGKICHTNKNLMTVCPCPLILMQILNLYSVVDVIARSITWHMNVFTVSCASGKNMHVVTRYFLTWGQMPWATSYIS